MINGRPWNSVVGRFVLFLPIALQSESWIMTFDPGRSDLPFREAIAMGDPYSFLRCLETSSRLTLANGELVDRLNAHIARGNITNKLGQSISVSLEKALVNESRTLLYAIINDIPQMLIDEAISLDQLQSEEG
jgi:uncharacterized protein YbaR (Trm112 family)